MDSASNCLSTPLFIVGPLRSGTTMLRLLMGNHPEIACFGEFECSVSQARGTSWPPLESFYEFVATDRQTKAHNFSVDKSLDYPALIKSFLAQASERNPSKIIGSSIHSRIDLLPDIWPEAKYVHILRDPRDVARSCIGMGWVGNVYHGSKYWLEPETHWDILEGKVSEENRITVRYEDLVRNPEAELARLCEFLGLEYDERMLGIDENSTYSRPSGDYADQWKRKMSKREISWVEAVCAPMMKKRGYEITTDTSGGVAVQTRLSLMLQNRWYRVSNNVRRWGFLSWAQYIVLKRIGTQAQRARIMQRIADIQTSGLK
ncbi:MAG: hypothetical protein ACI93R_002166 [Flavobacteriales bacterium]|jgi:hypothetical protein